VYSAECLRHWLRPAGGGIYAVSTGAAAQKALQRRIYGAADDVQVMERWYAALDRLSRARLVVLGVPSDVGAGFYRGASFGPQAIRQHLLDQGSWIYRDDRVVDLGDVRVVPQILHDEMLSPKQIADTRAALYPDRLTDSSTEDWPVSPLSITEATLDLVRQIAPTAIPLVLGGDHAIGWPVAAALARGRESRLGILHFDAHTDMLATRLGVRYCFATWAFHANALIGGGQRLAQVGIRISSKTREHWEAMGVRQYWMREVWTRPIAEIAAEIIANFRASGVEGLYISNDIDGTDPLWAGATGTPEAGGLSPDMVIELIHTVGGAFPVWGTDLVEVAPPRGPRDPVEPGRTLDTAALYLEAQAEVALALRQAVHPGADQ